MVSFNCAFAYSEDNLLEAKPTLEIKNEFTKEPEKSNIFNLTNIANGFLNYENSQQETVVKQPTTRENFISATSKFNQGNTINAYEEYSNLIESIDNDLALLNLSKVFYRIGFFSLANKATDKIVYKNQYYNNIDDLEMSYKPKAIVAKEDEIYFAKLYSSIFYDNSASEALNDLISKKEQYNKNDYYHFILSQCYHQLKQYSKALRSIDKAISINPNNINYKVSKIDILISANKFQDANKLILKLEKNKKIIEFMAEIKAKKQTTMLAITGKEKDKKYYALNKSYLDGNFEKTKKDCLNILNFDKNNDKIIALYAKAELALGNIERANTYFYNAYKIEKNNQDTLIGLGDIRFIHRDYKNSIKMYKKALSKDKNNPEILLKLLTVQKESHAKQKDIKKTTVLFEKNISNNYESYYNCAISNAQKNPLLKEEFLKKALDINPMYKNAIGELIEIRLKNKDYKDAMALIESASYTLQKNYYYYYLLGLYSQAINKKRDAIYYYKTSLNLNPTFEIANSKLLNLIPSTKDEEI